MLPDSGPLLKAALAYAASGWPVFPCHAPAAGGCTCGLPACVSPAKHPRTEHGFLDATREEARIREWWTRWPAANVAIATGARSDLLVLDVDPRHGGDETLREMERRHGPLPPTPEVLTGGGGRHLYFQHPATKVASSAGAAGPGLDIKADGGYVVAPGSVHQSGKTYRWGVGSHPNDVPLAPAPLWLLAACQERRSSVAATDTATGLIPEGHRHETLVKMAGALRRQGATNAALEAALLAVNVAQCAPPLPEVVVIAIATSGGRWATGQQVAAKCLGELLDGLAAFIRRYVILSAQQADAISLWIAHAWAFEAADATPYLNIYSPEKRSGKTRLLELLEVLVARPWLTGRVSAAVLVRKIDQERSTLLLDESDAAFRGEKEYAEALRGVLNGGHRRGGVCSLCVGQGTNIMFKDFSVFSPKAIAGIGKLPDTVADRSIPIRLKRRLKSEKVARFRRRLALAEAESVRTALATWATGAIDILRDAEPHMPEALDDRAQDGWEPLLAIADLAGGEWPQRAKQAAEALSGADADVDPASLGVALLRDIRLVLKPGGELPTAMLLERLKALEESPWRSMGKRSERITPRLLAELLRPYGVGSRTVHVDGKSLKGYRAASFEDAWARYVGIPSAQGAKSHDDATDGRADGVPTAGVPSTPPPHDDATAHGARIETPQNASATLPVDTPGRQRVRL